MAQILARNTNRGADYTAPGSRVRAVLRNGSNARRRSSRRNRPNHASSAVVSGTSGGNHSPIRTYDAMAPPIYPVSRTAPSTAVGGSRYNTIAVSCSDAMTGSADVAQPIRVHSWTYQGSNVSFQRALIRTIRTGATETTRPAQTVHCSRVPECV